MTNQEIEEKTEIEKEAEKFEKWLTEKADISTSSANMYSSYIKRLPQPLDFQEKDGEQIKAVLHEKVTTGPVRSAFKKYLQYLDQEQGYGKKASMEVKWVKDQIDQFEVSNGNELDKSEVIEKYLKSSEIQTLIQYVEKEVDRSWFHTEREFDEFRILPLLLFETGARVSEMLGKQQDESHVGLRVADITFKENRITIRDAKYGKNRTADFDLSEEPLRNYLEKHDIESGQVFEIDYFRFLRKLKSVSDKALNQEVTTHAFRHSFATNWVIQRKEEGQSWADAKEKVNAYLDHNDMKTTEAYIGAAKELVRENIYEEHGSFGLDLDVRIRGDEE